MGSLRSLQPAMIASDQAVGATTAPTQVEIGPESVLAMPSTETKVRPAEVDGGEIPANITLDGTGFQLDPPHSSAIDKEAPDQASPADYQIDDLGLNDDHGPAVKTTRFTLTHEASAKTDGSAGLVNNRSAFRVEYSKFIPDSFFMRLDVKVNSYWGSDHRARARDEAALLETNTQEAYLQYSAESGRTSVRAGVMRLIWGESEGGAITDEVSPRNLSELFLIPLEESRLGQVMLNIDHFSPIGDWSFFYVPRPRYNKYPERGTEYFFDPLAGVAFIRDDPSGDSKNEFGMRWKRTFGRSDVSVLAARLIDNNYVLRFDGLTAEGLPLLTRVGQRLTMSGITFSHVRGNLLFKGEAALKSPLDFNDVELVVVKKDVLDSSIGVTYALGYSNTIGVEWVNRRILGWNDRIVGVPENSASLVINANLFFLNDNLSVNWLTFYSRPYTSYQSSIRAAYKWSDNLSFGVDLHLVAVPDRRSGLRTYRDEDQLVGRIQYQF